MQPLKIFHYFSRLSAYRSLKISDMTIFKSYYLNIINYCMKILKKIEPYKYSFIYYKSLQIMLLPILIWQVILEDRHFMTKKNTLVSFKDV